MKLCNIGMMYNIENYYIYLNVRLGFIANLAYEE